MRIYIIIGMIIGLSSNLQAQITIINNSNTNFSNLYIIDYDSTLKTTGFCETITEKNLLKKRLDVKKQSTIRFNTNPSRYYNVILLDTTEYPYLYNTLAMKYYVSGKSKRIFIDSTNIEKDFKGYCTEGLADPDFEDFKIDVNNNKDCNVIKLYFKFNEDKIYKRYMELNQWKPITKNSKKRITLYNSKPKNADVMYIKYYVEEKGKISENATKVEIKSNQRSLDLEIGQ